MIKYAIFDIDGTLSDCAWRRSFAKLACYAAELGHIEESSAWWRKFHQRSLSDTPHNDTAEVLRAWIAAGHRVVYITGRSDEYRNQTYQWLERWGLPCEDVPLFMRPQDWLQPTVEYKRCALASVRKQVIGEIVFAIDDDERCVEMYREAGVPCFQPRPRQY